MSDFIHVICENYVPTSFGLAGEHGLSALVSVGGKKVLLDTGQGIGLINNAKMMGIDLNGMDALALSHAHKDHTGGLMDFLDVNGRVDVVAHPDVFVPRAVKRQIGGKVAKIPIGLPWQKDDLESAGAQFKLSAGPVEIVPGVWFSGEVPWKNDFEKENPSLFIVRDEELEIDPFTDDAALFIDTPKGITVLAGCAHRGIVNTMEHAREVLGDKPFHTVIGGIHLIDADADRVEKTIEAFGSFGVETVSTGHCTGLPASFEIARRLGDAFDFMAVGKRYEI